MLLTADQMAFRARALAQSEPFTQLARDVVQQDMATERDAQPGNFAIWASAAYTKGYCARRVEEDDVAMQLVASPPEKMPPVEDVVAMTDAITVALRSDNADLHQHLISDEDRILDVLDQIIGSEVRNRVDNASEKLTSRARQELEDYLTFWVVKGYALRAAEQATGAITADAPDPR